jgi:hypothetical protein
MVGVPDGTSTLARWRLDGQIWATEIDHVPWLVDGSVDWIAVTADDVVTPADQRA